VQAYRNSRAAGIADPRKTANEFTGSEAVSATPSSSLIASSGTTSAADGAKRRQIVDGARTVFMAQGFDAASMGEIAKAAAYRVG
jgi:hypothetical protein